MADEINRVPGEDESLNMENSLGETSALNDQAEAGDMGGGPSAPEAQISDDSLSATTFGEQAGSTNLDSGAPADTGETAQDADKGLMDKIKDKYNEMMNDK